MALEPYEFMVKMEKRMFFSDQDKSVLQSSIDWGKESAPVMATVFYDYLGRDPEMNAILNASEGRIDRLRKTFIQWFYDMFTGIDEWGECYAESRWRIGLIHVRIGIGPQHVVLAMATVIRAVESKLEAEGKTKDLNSALSKICMIDLAFIEQAYVEIYSEAFRQEAGWTESFFRRLIAQRTENL
ncbi:MAG TPA: hypothetical protein DCF68_11750 [Cyanothece sp. UBA12306]|nr:hypothetical protein [Cyanothece sp. UBA12306]